MKHPASLPGRGHGKQLEVNYKTEDTGVDHWTGLNITICLIGPFCQAQTLGSKPYHVLPGDPCRRVQVVSHPSAKLNLTSLALEMYRVGCVQDGIAVSEPKDKS